MSELVTTQNEEIVAICSTDVAEMIGKDHKYVIRDIEGTKNVIGIIPTLLGASLSPAKYFIKSSYKDKSGKRNKCYLVTKMGCELIGNKQQGEKGILFTAKYVEKFNKMEQQSKNPILGLSKELQAIFTLDKKQQEIEVKVEKLYNIMTIDYSQQEELRMTANAKAVEILGGKKTEAYKELKHKVFQDLWRSYKRHFRVNSYKNTATKDFENAINFIENFKVDKVLEYAIQGLNRQKSFA